MADAGCLYTISVMTLFESKPFDPVQARKRQIRIVVIVAIVAVLAILAWNFRHYPEERQVDRKKPTAYGTRTRIGGSIPRNTRTTASRIS